MNTPATFFWTFNDLVGAFLDLFIAYFVLCGSTIALFAVKFLGFFGMCLPTPSKGFFGILSSDYRWLLVDYPTDKISAVQFSARRKFPFDSIFFGVHNCDPKEDLNLNRGDGVMELEGEASCSSRSDPIKLVGNEIDDSGVMIENEWGLDMKGKGALDYRLRGDCRRRRRDSFDCGKQSSVSSSSNWVTCVDLQINNDEEHSCGEEGSSILSDVNNCNYEADSPMVVKSVGRHHEDIVFGDTNDAQKRIPVNEVDKEKTIVCLTRELEESQAAQAALYIELEKERNAAASAAYEAMSMILRLQEEKASVKIESRQYQRMIEEKSAYDEEEMNILKEIVLRREREKHSLEKQVEAYRQMISVQNDDGNNQDFIQDPDLISQKHQDFDFPKKKNSRLYEDFDFSKQDEPDKTIVLRRENSIEIKPVDASRVGETGLHVYDVPLIDNEQKSSGKSDGNKLCEKQTDKKQSGLESVGLPSVCSEGPLRRNSTSALENERTRFDTEVEWLRERLRIVQEGRENLNLCVDKERLQLQLLEDITRQLKDMRTLTEPQIARRASLSLLSSKVGSMKKRRCRSVSSRHAKSS